MTIRIYDYLDYKDFVRDFLRNSPKQGRGQLAKFAEVAQTHKATISQVFSGDKHLSCEQAVRIAKYMGLRPKQVTFFILLVDYERAGSEDLRQIYREQIEELRTKNQDLSQRLPKGHELSGEDRAVFYSSWIYSAVRVLSSIPGYQTREQIRKKLNLSDEVVGKAIEFLLRCGLCVERGTGKIAPGLQSTYIESKSPLVVSHHGNWRVKAMEKHPQLSPVDELSFTAPFSLSARDAKKIREILAQSVEKIDGMIAESPCERMFCLNVDWFEVTN